MGQRLEDMPEHLRAKVEAILKDPTPTARAKRYIDHALLSPAKDAPPMTVTLELPWPCSVNHYYFTANVRGRQMRIIGRGGKEYQNAVQRALYAAGSPRLEGDLRVNELILRPPNNVRRDLDNVLKCLWDSLQDRESKKSGVKVSGLFHDDCQIREYRCIKWGPVVAGGKVCLRISQIQLPIFS